MASQSNQAADCKLPETLGEIIRAEVERKSAIPFVRFMELALYHPEYGYYERTPAVVGRTGDYYTSVSVGPVFGELLAYQLGEWLEGKEDGGSVVLEAGAHDGRLAADMLGSIRRERPQLLERLEYWILEPSERRRQWQAQTLGALARRVRWFAGWPEMERVGVQGVVVANELLDAMPVCRMGWDAGNRRWFEWGVSWEGGQFVWVKLDKSAPGEESSGGGRLGDLGQTLGISLPTELLEVLPDGFTVEHSPAALAWWSAAARTLRRGRLMAFDYGHTAEELLAPERAGGTLRAYCKHRVTRDCLGRVGEQDLTADVNFTAIQAAGEAAGLRTVELRAQGAFLTGVVAQTWQSGAHFPAWTASRLRQFQTLTHPEHLGRAFRVLIQER